MSRRLLFAVLVAFLTGFFGARDGSASSGQVMVSLHSIRLEDGQMIGQLWPMEDSYEYVCKAERIRFANGQTRLKQMFWAGFYDNTVRVSADTKCVVSDTSSGREFVDKWVSRPYLYRYPTTNHFDPFPNLISAHQVDEYVTYVPLLYCRAQNVGVLFNVLQSNGEYQTITKRYSRVVFSPYLNPFGSEQAGMVWSSRDIQCTSNFLTLFSWLKQSGWKWRNIVYGR